MHKYWLYFRLSLIRTFTYRGQLLIFTLATVVSVIPLIAVWLSLGNISAGGYSQHELITYYIVGLFIQRIIYSSLINYYVQEIVSDGSIVGLFLTKPVSFFWATFGLQAGWLAVSLVLGATVTTAFALIIGTGIVVHLTLGTALFFLSAVMLGMLLVFVTSLLLGLLSFWTVHISSFVSLYWMALFLFGGITLPLTFFPDKIEKVLSFNPFRFVFSFPLEILLGKISSPELLSGYITTLVWIGLSVAGYKLIWRLGNKAYTGYGQ